MPRRSQRGRFVSCVAYPYTPHGGDVSGCPTGTGPLDMCYL